MNQVPFLAMKAYMERHNCTHSCHVVGGELLSLCPCYFNPPPTSVYEAGGIYLLIKMTVKSKHNKVCKLYITEYINKRFIYN
jgi:hypothetical protein